MIRVYSVTVTVIRAAIVIRAVGQILLCLCYPILPILFVVRGYV